MSALFTLIDGLKHGSYTLCPTFFFPRHGTDSTKVRLVDGPGRCAGRLEIQYEGKWQRVAEGEATNNFLNHVCQELKCGEAGTKETQGFSQGSGSFFPRALTCPPGATRISQCIKDKKVNAPGGKALALTCKSECVSRWSLLSLTPPPRM